MVFALRMNGRDTARCWDGKAVGRDEKPRVRVLEQAGNNICFSISEMHETRNLAKSITRAEIRRPDTTCTRSIIETDKVSMLVADAVPMTTYLR